MAFNLGGFIRGFASVLPNYVQGAETARKANWDDMQQYNQARSGQLQNLWTQATWEPRMSMMRDAATNSELGTLGGAMNFWNDFTMFPGKNAQAQAWSWAMTHGMANDQISGQWGALLQPFASQKGTGVKFPNPGEMPQQGQPGNPYGGAYDPHTLQLLQEILAHAGGYNPRQGGPVTGSTTMPGNI